MWLSLLDALIMAGAGDDALIHSAAVQTHGHSARAGEKKSALTSPDLIRRSLTLTCKL